MMIDFLSDTLPEFITDYAQCRERFNSAVKQLSGVPVERYTYSYDDRDVSIGYECNVAYIGSTEAEKVLVLISGTHGVEGYCGSSVQYFLLQQLLNSKLKLPDDTALLFVHALNPWGMCWARRCDHSGIDINRNFIDFTRLPPAEKDYAEIIPFLEIENLQTRKEMMDNLVKKWGQAHFDRVFSGGQYHCSWAPFYGGEAASFSRSVMEDSVSRWQLEGKTLVVIDIHTGLGPWSYGELISDHQPGSIAASYARDLFGPAVSETLSGGSFSVEKNGLLDYFWHQYMQEQGCFLTLEFGTLGTSSLFNVLLSDHIFWKACTNPDVTDERYLDNRDAMLHHFCPQDRAWQQSVLFRSWQVVSHVIEYFHEK